jgi:hypothetical protein
MQSVEFRVSEVVFVQLLRQASMPATLVAGPAMAGHEFSPGLHDVRGRTCPWNTFAIWNAHQLALTGFPMVAEGMGEDWGGVEEVSSAMQSAPSACCLSFHPVVTLIHKTLADSL